MRENKLNIQEELKNLKIKLDINRVRYKKLDLRRNKQINNFIDNFINENIYLITTDKENIDVKDACIAIKNSSAKEVCYYRPFDYTNILIIYFVTNGEYVLDVETTRIVEGKNYNNFVLKNSILMNVAALCEANKEYLAKKWREITLQYSILQDKLEVQKTENRIFYLKELLVKMEEDLLLEVGNVYTKGKITFTIIRVDDELGKVYCKGEVGREWDPLDKKILLENIKSKDYVPDKITSRKIKLKRLLYEN